MKGGKNVRMKKEMPIGLLNVIKETQSGKPRGYTVRGGAIQGPEERKEETTSRKQYLPKTVGRSEMQKAEPAFGCQRTLKHVKKFWVDQKTKQNNGKNLNLAPSDSVNLRNSYVKKKK